MSSTSENETEILLGNRHLLAIFFVLAVLLGIAFTGGYMVGRNGSDKKPAALSASAPDPVAATTSLESHVVAPGNEDGTTPADPQIRTVEPPPPVPDVVQVPVREDPKKQADAAEAKEAQPTKQAPVDKASGHGKTRDPFSGPQSGQTFLQVAAVGHTEANALADVLSKKGFHAHAVAKPGASDVYRVLIGPMRDTSDLSTTRDSLRNAGFTKIIVQRY